MRSPTATRKLANEIPVIAQSQMTTGFFTFHSNQMAHTTIAAAAPTTV